MSFDFGDLSIDKKSSSDGDFEIPKAGLRNAICNGIWDVGYHEKYQQPGVYGPKVVLGFETEDLHSEKNVQLTIYTFGITKNLYNSKLCKYIQSWIGRSLTDDEINGSFNLSDLIGKRCTLQISHSDCGKWPNIQNVLEPLPNNDLKIMTTIEEDPWKVKREKEKAFSMKKPEDPASKEEVVKKTVEEAPF